MSEAAAAREAEEERIETVRFGLQWPDAEPAELRQAAAAWREMAAALDGVRSRLNPAAARVAGANRGEAIDRFGAFWDDVSTDTAGVASACRAIATALDDFADAVEEVRQEILRLAAEIAASVAIGVGLAFFTAGLSAAAVTATTARIIAIAARLCTTLSIRAATIMSRVAVVGAFGAIESAAVNVTVQLGSNAAFNDNHDPLDGFSLDQSLAAGAFGGALAAPVAGLASAAHLARATNATRGAMGEELTEYAIRARGGQIVGRQVTVRTPGARVRPDLLARDADGVLGWADSKVVQAGRRPTYTPGQRVGFPELATVGGVPVGRKAVEAGLRPGVALPPMPVTIYQWRW